jgi:hypothetical protein
MSRPRGQPLVFRPAMAPRRPGEWSPDQRYHRSPAAALCGADIYLSEAVCARWMYGSDGRRPAPILHLASAMAHVASSLHTPWDNFVKRSEQLRTASICSSIYFGRCAKRRSTSVLMPISGCPHVVVNHAYMYSTPSTFIRCRLPVFGGRSHCLSVNWSSVACPQIFSVAGGLSTDRAPFATLYSCCRHAGHDARAILPALQRVVLSET